jgi:hypothetical protein
MLSSVLVDDAARLCAGIRQILAPLISRFIRMLADQILAEM